MSFRDKLPVVGCTALVIILLTALFGVFGTFVSWIFYSWADFLGFVPPIAESNTLLWTLVGIVLLPALPLTLVLTLIFFLVGVL